MLSFAEENDQADVFKHCMNSTNSTSCSFTYEHVYNSLTKNESNFNISYALYPDGAKPSFLVRVNVYGPNRTSNSMPAKFTWSIHCLYANVPAWPLQILSLFSITVTSRTQELNIKVPSFCCNMSDDKKEREEMIQEFLTRTIFEVSVNKLLLFCKDQLKHKKGLALTSQEIKHIVSGNSLWKKFTSWQYIGAFSFLTLY